MASAHNVAHSKVVTVYNDSKCISFLYLCIVQYVKMNNNLHIYKHHTEELFYKYAN